jgi:hypothetical protein
MRVLKLTLVGVLVAVLGATLYLRVIAPWQLDRVDKFVASLVGVVHASQARRASPHESVSETIDGSRITITYGRPYMRGREIFGRLVPFGRVWCPGADEATTLESTKELMLDTLRVSVGPHTIWVLPTEDRWTLVVSKDPSGFHTQYHPDRDLGRIELHKREVATPVEQLTFAINRRDAARGGTIAMTWERTEVSVPFTVVE